MKTGISTASFFLREECEQAIKSIKALGAECAEVFLGTYYEYRPEFAKAHAGEFAGIDICACHSLSTNFEPQLFSPSRRVRGDAYYWLDQLMRSAQILGARKYTFHGYTGFGAGGADIAALSEHMCEVAEFCSRYGVELCLENVAWGAYNRPGVFGEFKSRCPSLSGVLDLKQARRSGYPYGMYIADMAGSISHVHLSDVDENGKMCLPGKGVYDFAEIFSRLADAGFNGEAIIEVYGDNYGGTEELKASLDYLGEILCKTG